MVEDSKHASEPFRIHVLVGVVTLAAAYIVLFPEWEMPSLSSAKFWNALAAFSLLGIACDAAFLRIPFANVSSSVAFIPFIGSVLLFPHPWPTVIAGLTCVVVDTFVRRKPVIRLWYNTAQYMVAVGLGGMVYTALGGPVSLDLFSFRLIPFTGLVTTFFVVNALSVSLAVAFSTGVSFKESWGRLAGGGLVYDLLSSSLAVLLVFLYLQLQFVGLVLLLLPLFFVRRLHQVNLQLEEENREKLELMVKAIEARDPYTYGHSRRVSEYARTIARELAVSARDVDNIEAAALLHDVGKIYEDFAPLLRKGGKLSPEERMTMQTHAVRSAELVGTVRKLRGAVQQAIRHHHENFDGSGYPDGLAGGQIPIGARIIMIADTIDAMTTDRPYRKALTYMRAIEELHKYAGGQFDPELVKIVSNSPAIRRLLGPEPVAAAEMAPTPALRTKVRERAARAAL